MYVGLLIAKILILVGSLSLAGTVEPEFKPYVREIKRDIKSFCNKDEFQHRNFKILFSNLSGDEIGLCQRNRKGFLITIDYRAWQHLTETTKYQLLAHEMSHCMLHLDHSKDDENYMNPYLRKNLSIHETRLQMIAEIGKVCTGEPVVKWNTRAMRAPKHVFSVRPHSKRSRSTRRQ